MQPSVANASHRCDFCHVVGARIARPPIFCKLSIFPPQRPPSSREGDRPQAVEGVPAHRAPYHPSRALSTILARSPVPLPKDLPLRGRGTARRRWKEFSDGGRSKQTVEGVFSRWKAYSFPKLKYMRQNAEPCACFRRILLILYLIRRGQSMSLPFSGGNIRPERKKFNKSNSPLSPPLTALKFLNIPALFFRNSLDFAARHRLQ